MPLCAPWASRSPSPRARTSAETGAGAGARDPRTGAGRTAPKRGRQLAARVSPARQEREDVPPPHRRAASRPIPHKAPPHRAPRPSMAVPPRPGRPKGHRYRSEASARTRRSRPWESRPLQAAERRRPRPIRPIPHGRHRFHRVCAEGLFISRQAASPARQERAMPQREPPVCAPARQEPGRPLQAHRQAGEACPLPRPARQESSRPSPHALA